MRKLLEKLRGKNELLNEVIELLETCGYASLICVGFIVLSAFVVLLVWLVVLAF